MAELKPYKGNYYLWEYVPSKPAGLVFAILYALATVVIVWRIVRTKTLFSIAFAVGGIFETLGYAVRAIAEDKTDQLGIYIMQSILILVAPALFAASLYMVLGRLMRSIHGERHSLIPIKWLTRAFVIGDIFSFLVQSTGGGLMGTSGFDPKTGQNIILAGLFIQIAMFGLFIVTSAVFDVRMRRWPSRASLESGRRWKNIMAMLYTTSALIMLRSVFRVIEYVMGKEGYLLKNEWTLYVFDAVPILLVMILYAVIYPGELRASNLNKPRDMDELESDSVNTTGDLEHGGREMK
ncbi:hypothetical protein DCS_01544 [Drechmeria coniospora]|uniref:RTA1 like protein n=1 Tax=Drechmeria coniospora TaxID=98403 RepID=A0A151GTI2_DRECN|nr:hypothetical protein DCS_01544 [Drechmeria coniospora]KYK60407.1 hypothetical protein DCS_01544 [Drechmeria coniospora]